MKKMMFKSLVFNLISKKKYLEGHVLILSFNPVFMMPAPEKAFSHFDKYPLLTQKKADYLLFKSAVYLMNEGEHLTDEGLRKLVSIRASMNNGLTEVIKTLFPDIIPVKRPIIQNSSILISDPY
jgi:hypothetical protein